MGKIEYKKWMTFEGQRYYLHEKYPYEKYPYKKGLSWLRIHMENLQMEGLSTRAISSPDDKYWLIYTRKAGR